jgi:hypothetical protein
MNASAEMSDLEGDRQKKLGSLLLPSPLYIVVAPDSGDVFTPFQGFSASIANAHFVALVRQLAILPATSFEIFVEHDRLPELRGPIPRKRAAIVGEQPLLSMIDHYISMPDTILVFLGLDEQIQAVRSVANLPKSAIFISGDRSEGVLGLRDSTAHPAQVIDEALLESLLRVLPEGERERVAMLGLRAPYEAIAGSSRGSGVTMPNEAVETSLGFRFADLVPIDAGNPADFESAIVASSLRIQNVLRVGRSEVVLYAPAIARQLYDFSHQFWNGLLRKIKSKWLRTFIRDGVFRNKKYSGFSVPDFDPRNIQDPYEDPIAGPMLAVRQLELALSTAGIAGLAANNVCPAVRLPNAVNLHGGALREIEQHSMRSDDRGRRLLQKAYLQLANEMSAELGSAIVAFIRDRSDAITFVGDAPIEWLRIAGLPAMIRFEMSRISMTPGNAMLEQCSRSWFGTIASSALSDVLVVRSFEQTDPIREVLETALGSFDLERIAARFVDVESEAKLIEALNSFEGSVVIFDCHGGHSGDSGHGWLSIGSDRVDVWGLAYRARIPPIVILSACSTFALAGSHASVGNGLLRSGAIAVVGTLLPVNAAKSSLFVARLLYRIDAFLPAIRELGVELITWRSLVSTFLQMSYATDVLRFFEQKAWLGEGDFPALSIAANMSINSHIESWYSDLLEGVAEATSRSRHEIEEVLGNESPLVETMYYCQIGRPETIGIDVSA